ncbi:unnamed protein product [Caretta caretta]
MLRRGLVCCQMESRLCEVLLPPSGQIAASIVYLFGGLDSLLHCPQLYTNIHPLISVQLLWGAIFCAVHHHCLSLMMYGAHTYLQRECTVMMYWRNTSWTEFTQMGRLGCNDVK